MVSIFNHTDNAMIVVGGKQLYDVGWAKRASGELMNRWTICSVLT